MDGIGLPAQSLRDPDLEGGDLSECRRADAADVTADERQEEPRIEASRQRDVDLLRGLRAADDGAIQSLFECIGGLLDGPVRRRRHRRPGVSTTLL
jgi:hypothetical protein